MADRLREVELLVPRSVDSGGDGLLSFAVKVETPLDPRRYEVQLFVDLPGGEAGARLRAAAGPGGLANLVLPGRLHGQTSVNVDIFDRERGRRFRGAFLLTVRRTTQTGSIVVNAGGHQVSENAVNYQPIDIRGVEARPVETVGDRVRMHLPLEEQHLQDPIPIHELIDGERFLVLSEEPVVRVLDIHVGPRLVVGRCYGRDIPGGSKAHERLCEVCPGKVPRVNWVTAWDDRRLNRLLVAVEVQEEPDRTVLRFENLTDYSRLAAKPMEVLVEGTSRGRVEPGETVDIATLPGEEIVLCVEAPPGTLEVLRLTTENVEVGRAGITVIRTIRSRFFWPPDREGREIHFLGLWIPRTREDLSGLLQSLGGSLWVGFPEEDGLGLEIDWDGRLASLAVAGTMNLRACLERR